MACASSNNPNAICVSYDGTDFSFDPDELDFTPGSVILWQRGETDWTFESFSWVEAPPPNVFGSPVVTPSTITLTDNDSSTGAWRYKICISYNGTSPCSDPKIVNM